MRVGVWHHWLLTGDRSFLDEYWPVIDAAVVGMADEQWGEAVVAVVVLRVSAEASMTELQQWVKDRLRSSRTPERIEFWDELPYNETGKLLRRKVREALRDSD